MKWKEQILAVVMREHSTLLIIKDETANFGWDAYRLCIVLSSKARSTIIIWLGDAALRITRLLAENSVYAKNNNNKKPVCIFTATFIQSLTNLQSKFYVLQFKEDNDWGK